MAVNLHTTALLNAFHLEYQKFEDAIRTAFENGSDTIVLERLGDRLDEFLHLVHEHTNIFNPDELRTIVVNINAMRNDVHFQHRDLLSESHHGHPTVISQEEPAPFQRGRPKIHIDPEFLAWAYTQRSISSIAHFLGVHRHTIRRCLIEYGIVNVDNLDDSNTGAMMPSSSDNFAQPFGNDPGLELLDDILDPNLPIPASFPQDIHNDLPALPQVHSSTSQHTSLTSLNDDDLDQLLIVLRSHYHRAGLSVLDGMLRALGYRITREHLRQALVRVDPVRRVFERIRIRRREYKVAGPNALWHHDGQHGLIRWGIVIQGFIDGYSRLITALRASNNNRAETVLALFLDAAQQYHIPSRVRGDHGVENLRVAEYMEHFWGPGCGSYIWGRSVHNVRIERLWVDVTAQVGAKWGDFFTILELHHGLDINNVHHIWLLHHLFLAYINFDLAFFTKAWNEHKITIRGGPRRSPADMYGFDMLIHGVRGDTPTDTITSDEELEVYGLDWEALQDDTLRASQAANNPLSEGWTSWLGRTGPPDHLNEVSLESPQIGDHDRFLLDALSNTLPTLDYTGIVTHDQLVTRWIIGLATAVNLFHTEFGM